MSEIHLSFLDKETA